MIKLCIFDLDGTVLDTVRTIAYYTNTALKLHGMGEIPTEEYKYLAGGGAAKLIHGALAHHGEDTPRLFQAVYDDYIPMYDADVAYLTTIFDGLRDELDALKRTGIKLAIVSNKPDRATQAVVCATWGEGYFDYVTGHKPGGVLKPDIAEVVRAMDIFGATPDECMYFGDTSTDMITGKRAGIFTVGVLWGFRGREELLINGADALLEQPCELSALVLGASKK